MQKVSRSLCTYHHFIATLITNIKKEALYLFLYYKRDLITSTHTRTNTYTNLQESIASQQYFGGHFVTHNFPFLFSFLFSLPLPWPVQHPLRVYYYYWIIIINIMITIIIIITRCQLTLDKRAGGRESERPGLQRPCLGLILIEFNSLPLCPLSVQQTTVRPSDKKAR